jgi:UDP-N-acetylglucosamine 2-epimerase (non-hydrolysing)
MSDRLRIVATIGTRPEAVKMAPVVRALADVPWADVRVLATAQHREMLDQQLGFFGIDVDEDLDIMQPDQSLADLTGRLIPALDAAWRRLQPQLVLAQGDTTTVLAVGLTCFYRQIAFGHVEAGLRTHDKHYPFPEEMNRALAARLADLHFAPTERARRNLLAEGIDDARIFVTGNTAIDSLLWTAERVSGAPIDLPGPGPVILVTAHRRESFGEPLEEICEALAEIARLRADVNIVFPVHPNPQVRGAVRRQLDSLPNVRLTEPLAYADFVALMKASALILTDSGGVQEEAPSLGRPVLVLRDVTERPEGVEVGCVKLVGPHRRRIVDQTLQLLDDRQQYERMARVERPYGDGRAAQRIVRHVYEWMVQQRRG